MVHPAHGDPKGAALPLDGGTAGWGLCVGTPCDGAPLQSALLAAHLGNLQLPKGRQVVLDAELGPTSPMGSGAGPGALLVAFPPPFVLIFP